MLIHFYRALFSASPWSLLQLPGERSLGKRVKEEFFLVHNIHIGIFFEKFRPLHFLGSKAAAVQWCIHESTAQVLPIQPTIPAIYEQL